MRILLVEDDVRFGSGLQAWLSHKGYAIDWVQDGAAARQALTLEEYLLVLLDLQLPRLSGMDLLQDMRSHNNPLPVIVLTARDTLKDRLAGLDGGADDYLVKPFDLEELAARVRALIRRISGRAETVLRHDDVSLNPVTQTVTRANRGVDLSPKEFVVLQTLLENAGKPVSRAKLENCLYAWHSEVESNAVVVHVHNLRKKFGQEFIRTKRGYGYIVE